MAREIRLNAFDMNCVGHQSPGLWAHPRDRSWQYEEYKQYISLGDALALGSGWVVVDFCRYAPDEPLRHIEANAAQSSVETFSRAEPNKVSTLRALAEWIGARCARRSQ